MTTVPASGRGVGAWSAASAGPPPEGVRASVLLGGLGVGTAALLAVHFALLHTYWDYSEGVYALSSHLMVHGHGLYTGFVGAQPPGVFLTGAGLLALHDQLEWLRFGVACCQLGAGLIAGQIVWRITGHRLAAALTPAALLLTPWAVHEHGALTPELVGLPLLLGAALLGTRARGAGPAGVLCGLLPLVKVPFVLPAFVLVAVSADWRRSAQWAAGTLAACLGITTALAGESFWREAVIAQFHVGTRSLGELKGFWAQAGWNVLGLLFCAGVAVGGRSQARDPRLFRTTLALALTLILTFFTNFKVGTGLNITVPVEATLVPLAVCGVVFAFRQPRSARWVWVTSVLAVAFTLAQSVSLAASPHHSIPFLRAFSRPAWGAQMTAAELRRAVLLARACPPGVAYSGAPLVAFVADRPMADGQPDQFITTHSTTLAAVGHKMAAVTRFCP